MAWRLIILLLALIATACGADDDSTPATSTTTTTTSVDEGCPPGEADDGSGTCVRAGLPQDWSHPGIPPQDCAPGFTADEDHGCGAILPADSCPDGAMAVPGEVACRPVAECGAAPWGDVVAATAFVDGSYPGSDSDGSQSKPWLAIQQAIDVAADGATIAIAAGSYQQDLVTMGKSLTLWGRCPSMVTVEGVGSDGAVTAEGGAVVVRSLAITGSGAGVVATASANVTIVETWVHDTAAQGVLAAPTASVAITDSLIERARVTGAHAEGATLSLDRCAVRDTEEDSSLPYRNGAGVLADDYPPNMFSSVTIANSLIERSVNHGVLGVSSDVTIDASVIRDTHAGSTDGLFGRGIELIQGDSLRLANGSLKGSVLSGNHDVGVVMIGGTFDVQSTVIRDTLPSPSSNNWGAGLAVGPASHTGDASLLTVDRSVVLRTYHSAILVEASRATVTSSYIDDTLSELSSGAFGEGISALPSDWPQRADLVVRASTVERSHNGGIIVSGSDALIEDTLIHDTRPRKLDSSNGIGLVLQADGKAGQTHATVRRSSIEQSHSAGVQLMGAEVTFELNRVVDTKPSQMDDSFGRGIELTSAVASLDACAVDRSYDVGIFIGDAWVEMQATLVRNTFARARDGRFGDGVVVVTRSSDIAHTTANLAGCQLEASARVGLAAFGADVAVAATTLACNPIHLDAEPGAAGRAATIQDLGNNGCGCKDAQETCAVRSSNLEPPSPLQ